MLAKSLVGEQRVLLENISWQLFQMLLDAMGENRANRLTYDRGMLEIMTPLMPHEHYNRLIEAMIRILAEELNLNIKSVGSMTCNRQDLARGIEPDSSYYILNEPLMRGKTELDLSQDPPPDLVLEVDLTSPSLNKMSIYASLGVPEFWRYYRSELEIYQLQNEQYIRLANSPTFANLPLTEIEGFLAQSTQIGELAVMRAFRGWVRERI